MSCNNGITYGLTVSDRSYAVTAVIIGDDDYKNITIGQVLYWVEDEGYMVRLKPYGGPSCAGVYFGNDFYGLNPAPCREGFKGIFILKRSPYLSEPEIQKHKVSYV